MAAERTHDPGPEDFRALARSSPWLFTTVHLTHRQTGYAATQRPGTAEAWLDRRVRRVTVRSEDGVETSEGVPYGISGPRTVEREEPQLRPDGLILRRPEGWAFEHGDRMWRDYQWTAMLDPEELADGVELGEVEEVEHRGRRSWRAVCSPSLHRYDPRCGCCPLLDSLASRLVEYGPEDPTLGSPREELPTAYLVTLDAQTGIVVDLTPLDGAGGSSFTNVIHSVDQPLDAPAP